MEIAFLLVLLILIKDASTRWWLSSQVFTVGSLEGCSNIGGLVKEQKSLCRKYPQLMEVVGLGAQVGLKECQHQFATSKWNCSSVDQRHKGLLGLLTSKGNKEAAFFQAITSAGIVVEITKACNNRHFHKACGCDKSLSGKKDIGFEWSDCNDNVKFGMRFAQRFLDAREVGNDARVLMNKHNNLVGRKTVDSQMWLECTCHGVSGACNMKTCKRSLPHFYSVGDALQQNYHKAIHVNLDQSKNILAPRNQKEIPTESDLVFLEHSPDYCVKNLRDGTLGVAGRRCNKTSDGPDGCDVMCCGMGFHTKKVWVQTNCNCKFIWCCKVKCQKCRSEVKQYFCRSKPKRRGKNRRWLQHDRPNANNIERDINERMNDEPHVTGTDQNNS